MLGRNGKHQIDGPTVGVEDPWGNGNFCCTLYIYVYYLKLNKKKVCSGDWREGTALWIRG